MKPPDRKQLKAAFRKDLDQFHIDALTPDRGYPLPVDNLEKFIDGLVQRIAERKPTKRKGKH